MDEKMEPPSEDLEYLLYPYQLHSEVGLKESDKERVEKRFFDELKSLSEGAMQLAEFLSEDKRLCQEIYSLLKYSLGRLGLTIEIPVEALPFLEKVERVMLNERCHLIVVNEDGKIDSMALEECPPEVILMVVWNTIPKLKVLVEDYTNKVKRRVEYFDRISRDLRILQGVFDQPYEEAVPMEGLYQGQRPDAKLFRA